MKKYVMTLALMVSPLIAMDFPSHEGVSSAMSKSIDNATSNFQNAIPLVINPLVDVYAKHWEEWQDAIENYCDKPEDSYEDSYDDLFERMAEDTIPSIAILNNHFSDLFLEEHPLDKGANTDQAMIRDEVASSLKSPESTKTMIAFTKISIKQNAQLFSRARKKYLEQKARESQDAANEQETK